MTNLVGNALKFTKQGEVFVRLSLDQASPRRLKIEVRDTGIGMTEAQQARAGAGDLERLVEMMGGTIGVQSTPDAGSVFWFTVQVAAASSPTAQAPAPMALQGERILAVDDNATNRRVLYEQLKSAALEPVMFSSGAEALSALREARDPRSAFSAAVVDMHMPQMSGLSLAREIRRTIGFERLPLIMLTSLEGRGELGDDARLIDECLTKPTRQADLIAELRKVLAGATPSARRPVAQATLAPISGVALVAEDNLVNQRVVVHLLKLCGVSAVVASDGAQALAAFSSQRFSVVLMDCQMPGMDGYEACKGMRQHEAGMKSHTPIIALTASAMLGDRDRAIAAGMDDYLKKPLRLEELHPMLERWVQRPS